MTGSLQNAGRDGGPATGLTLRDDRLAAFDREDVVGKSAQESVFRVSDTA